MASGSQTYSGICADFPVAPTNNSSEMVVRMPELASTGMPVAESNTFAEIERSELPEDQKYGERKSESRRCD